MITQPVNSVMRLLLPASVPLDIDPKYRAQVEELSNAIQQLQNYIEQYCGITQKLATAWPQLAPADTLLDHQQNRLYAMAGEAIAYGAFVNVYDLGGNTVGLRNANATNKNKPAVGFCTTLGGIAAGAYGEVIIGRGLSQGVNGMVFGTRYFLSTTDGVVVNGEPAAAGNIGQYLGYAIGPKLMIVDINMQFTQH